MDSKSDKMVFMHYGNGNEVELFESLHLRYQIGL